MHPSSPIRSFPFNGVGAPTPARQDRHTHHTRESVLGQLSQPALTPSASTVLPSPIPRYTTAPPAVLTPASAGSRPLSPLSASVRSGSPHSTVGSRSTLHRAQQAYQDSVARAAARMDHTASLIAGYRQAAADAAAATAAVVPPARPASPSLLAHVAGENASAARTAATAQRSARDELQSLDKARADLALAMSFRRLSASQHTAPYTAAPPAPGSTTASVPPSPHVPPPPPLTAGASFHSRPSSPRSVSFYEPPRYSHLSADAKDATIDMLHRQLEAERERVRQVLNTSEQLLADTITEQEGLVLSQEEFINRLLADVSRYRGQVAEEQRKLRIAVRKLQRYQARVEALEEAAARKASPYKRHASPTSGSTR